MSEIGDHAVVLGASMGGLLAARVLADAYRRVTIVERDPLPESGLDRKGVPQGRHAHVLLPRGAQILDELFPGLLPGLAAGGVPVLHHRFRAPSHAKYARISVPCKRWPRSPCLSRRSVTCDYSPRQLQRHASDASPVTAGPARSGAASGRDDE